MQRWVRVSAAVQNLEQDQVAGVNSENDGQFFVTTLDGRQAQLPVILALPISDPTREPGEFLYCSVSPYQPRGDGELAFGANTLFIAKRTSDPLWLTGVAVTDTGNRMGSPGKIPMNSVIQLQLPTDQAAPFTTPRAVQPQQTVSQSLVPQTQITPSFTSDFSQLKLRDTSPYARAIYAFKGEYENELSFEADEIISLTRRVDAEWMEGAIGERKGIFPLSYVQIIVDLSDDAATTAKRHSRNEEDGIGYAIVKHDFQGRLSDELSMNAGDSVRVLKMVNTDWVMCRDPDTERKGIVPVGFLDLYIDDDEDEPREQNTTGTSSQEMPGYYTQDSFTRQTSTWKPNFNSEEPEVVAAFDKTPAQLGASWATFDDWITPSDKKNQAPPARPPPPKTNFQSPDEVVSVVEMFGLRERQSQAPPRPLAPSIFPSASSSDLSNPQKQMEKRQKVMEDLINTELQFISDMNMYTDVVNTSSRLNEKQRVCLANGCPQIVQLAGTLVNMLITEQTKDPEQQSIGAVFIELRKPFAQTYGYYFRNIDQINILIQQAKTDNQLQSALDELVLKMREGGGGVMDHAAAVSRPVQRCLKYPLFLSEFSKCTPVTHPDHPKLLEALKQMSNLGEKMNESKRRKELVRKYAEDQTSSTWGERLSKLNLHTLFKKTNRFKYRMGSSLGVVKLTRDPVFDNLVDELDEIEKRLVRFNYMLVIYRKKMFHETRIHLHKKVVEPRKKIVSSTDAEHQLYVFHEAVREFANDINKKVRDEIVKALHTIPKKLIRKRNDKQVDYEHAKAKDKSSSMSSDVREKFQEFNALNTQVRLALPKSIQHLNTVLQEAMKTVQAEDTTLMTKLRQLFDEQKSKGADPTSNRIILPNTPCFVDYFDPDRLKPLTRIANKAAQKQRTKVPTEGKTNGEKTPAAITFTDTTNTVTSGSATLPKSVKKKDWRPGEDWSKPIDLVPSVSVATPTLTQSSAPISTEKENKFRAQTAEERLNLIAKAKAKNRTADLFSVMVSYPLGDTQLREAKANGTSLIVNKDDVVLAVNRGFKLWLCYNGYYNAMIPAALLKPFSIDQAMSMESSNGFTYRTADISQQKANGSGQVKMPQQLPNPNQGQLAGNRPHSVPPKSQNLIDLEDIFGASSGSIPPLQPQPTTGNLSGISMVPTARSTASSSSSGQQNQSQAGFGAPLKSPEDDLFSGVKHIDWGGSSSSSSNQPTQQPPSTMLSPPDSSAYRPPSLPNLSQTSEFRTPTQKQQPMPSPAFPVTFDESPECPNTSQQSASSAWSPQPSSVVKRSDSPQPLIPTRPEPVVKQPTGIYPNLNAAQNVATPSIYPNPALVSKNGQLRYDAPPTSSVYDSVNI
ncbi:hypothetical protein WR25_09018 [Diploscapter pachys]|uniref:Dynamin-binding protein n=1 Tax=Diploscapter pachys TaxID=2018661 RepID=A0A2A2M135_9BILA|nr:hypothetical protein WR25_09018 [Diploscapter pachys]